VNTGNYSLRVTRLSDSAVFNFNNRQVSGGVDGIGLFNYDAEFNDQFFNSVALIPAPGAAALLGLGGLCAARRRRA
jgi:hypothetical protein